MLVIPSARNDIPRKREREFCRRRSASPPRGQRRSAALRRANYAEQARPSCNIGTPDLDEFPIAHRDIKRCDNSRRREVSYGLGFVTLMRDFITRSFLIVALMTRPILSGTLRPLFSLLYYRCAPDFPFFYLDICAANPRFR